MMLRRRHDSHLQRYWYQMAVTESQHFSARGILFSLIWGFSCFTKDSSSTTTWAPNASV